MYDVTRIVTIKKLWTLFPKITLGDSPKMLPIGVSLKWHFWKKIAKIKNSPDGQLGRIPRNFPFEIFKPKIPFSDGNYEIVIRVIFQNLEISRNSPHI